MLIMLHFL